MSGGQFAAGGDLDRARLAVVGWRGYVVELEHDRLRVESTGARLGQILDPSVGVSPQNDQRIPRLLRETSDQSVELVGDGPAFLG